MAFYSDKHGIFRVNSKDAAGGDGVTQRNIISERVLKMPRERTGDTDKPFKDVPRNSVA